MANLRKGQKKVFGGGSIRYLELTLIKITSLALFTVRWKKMRCQRTKKRDTLLKELHTNAQVDKNSLILLFS